MSLLEASPSGEGSPCVSLRGRKNCNEKSYLCKVHQKGEPAPVHAPMPSEVTTTTAGIGNGFGHHHGPEAIPNGGVIGAVPAQ